MKKGDMKDVSKLSMKKLAAIVDMKRAISDYLKQAETELRKRLAAGEDCKNFHLKPVNAKREWTEDQEKKIEDALRKFGFTKKALFKTSMLSPAQVEKLKLPKGTEKQDLSVLINHWLREKAPTMQLQSGPAPEVPKGAFKEFFEEK